MTPTLEDRLAAAASPLDRRIDEYLSAGPDPVAWPARTSVPTRALAVVACSATLVIGGLVWLSAGDADDPSSASDPTSPTSGTTDVTEHTDVGTTVSDPRSLGCGVTVDDGVIVASALDPRGRPIDLVVVDRPDVFGSTLLFDNGRGGSSAECSYESMSEVHPTGTWTGVGYMTSATETEAWVQGRLRPGAGPHDVTLSTGDVVRVTPGPQGWFLAVAVIPIAGPGESIEVVSTEPSIIQGPVPAVPVADAAPLAVGESVMLGATEQLQAGGFAVNASESRQGEAQVDVLNLLGIAGQIGETVVLQVGTNGPVDDAVFDDIMTVLADVDRVVFLTVHAPGKGWIAPNNALIFGLSGRYPNVSVLDWDGLVESGQVPGLAGDGIHLGTPAAKQFYANYVFGLLGRDELILPLPE